MNYPMNVVTGGTQKKSGDRAEDTRIPFLCLLLAPRKDKQLGCENQDEDVDCLSLCRGGITCRGSTGKPPGTAAGPQ